MGRDITTSQPVTAFLDGALTDSRSDERVEVINPSNGRHLLSIPVGCAADVEAAVGSARIAFEDGRWSDSAPSLKKRVLHRFADLIEKSAAELDGLDAGEMGKPVAEKLFSATAAAGLARFYAEAVDKVSGDVFSSDRSTFVVQRRVPRGLVGAIVPWNFPTFNAVLKFAPALAAGNCVVLKPSELSSRSAIRLAHLATDAGLPAGVLNVVPGLGETVGQSLALHMDVDMLTFTGSTEVGKSILEYAGRSNMKSVMTECGGKSPHIVFSDGVDVEATGIAIAEFLLANQGQICSVGSRVLVQRSVEQALLDSLRKRLKRIVMGDALDPKTTFGPVVSAKQCSRILGYIESGHTEGSELIMGGRRVLTETGGHFIEPTLFRVSSPNARIAQEEIFGPVLSVIPFDDEADAVKIANSTAYGLIAYVWTADLSRGLRMAKSIRSSVLINATVPTGEGAGHAISSEPAKQSGLGAEGGVAGMETYLRRQLVWFNHA